MTAQAYGVLRERRGGDKVVVATFRSRVAAEDCAWALKLTPSPGVIYTVVPLDDQGRVIDGEGSLRAS